MNNLLSRWSRVPGAALVRPASSIRPWSPNGFAVPASGCRREVEDEIETARQPGFVNHVYGLKGFQAFCQLSHGISHI